MIFKLPDEKKGLSKQVNDKISILKNQKSTFIYNGKVADDKEEEWNFKFEEYKKLRKRLTKLDSLFVNNKVTDEKYAESHAELRQLENSVATYERDLSTMVEEPIDKTDIDIVEARTEILSKQGVKIRTEKAVYPTPTGRIKK